MRDECCGNIICKTELFNGVKCDDFHELCSKLRTKTYEKGETVAREGSACKAVGIIVSGKIAMQKITTSGEFATLSLIAEGEFFGEDIIYSSQSAYSSTLEAMTRCVVQYINKDVLNSFMTACPEVKDNIFRILSDRIENQNRRIELLSQKTIREKIAYYLIDLYNQQKQTNTAITPIQCSACSTPCGKYPATSCKVTLPVSKEIIAKLLAMPRPSFSRELIAMEKDKLIKVNGRTIILCDVARLETEIVEGLNGK